MNHLQVIVDVLVKTRAQNIVLKIAKLANCLRASPLYLHFANKRCDVNEEMEVKELSEISWERKCNRKDILGENASLKIKKDRKVFLKYSDKKNKTLC